MAELRKYGESTTILFPLIDAGAVDFEATPVTHASGDTQISKDEGAFANTTNAFAHEGNGVYSIVLTATEMQAARIVVTIIDTATKTWEDQAVVIDTYGNASAQHAFDLDTAIPAVNTTQWNSAAVATPSVAGVPEIDITYIGGVAYNAAIAQLGVNVVNWRGTAAATPDTAGYPVVTIKDGTGQGEINLTSGVAQANVMQISGNSQAATNQSNAIRATIPIIVNTGNVAATTTTMQATGHTELTADHFIGRKLFWYDSTDTLFGQATSVTDYSWDAVNSEMVFTFQQLTDTPADGDLVMII